MLIDEINRQLAEGKTELKIRGSIIPVSSSPEVEIYGFVKIANLDGIPISPNTVVSSNVNIGMQASLSGSVSVGPAKGYPEVYRIDNNHPEIGLHEHTEQGVSKIEEKTVGEVISRFFRKALG